VPQNGTLLETAKRLDSAMKPDTIADVRSACAEFLATASGFYRVPTCAIRVLAVRPLRVRERGTFELFGDYDPETSVIRVWMRTAVRKEVTSFGTFVSTLCHEFCHHLGRLHLYRQLDLERSCIVAHQTRCAYEALLEHCGQDTLAMVRLLERLKSATEAPLQIPLP
jgi:hypothetical protein